MQGGGSGTAEEYSPEGDEHRPDGYGQIITPSPGEWRPADPLPVTFRNPSSDEPQVLFLKSEDMGLPPQVSGPCIVEPGNSETIYIDPPTDEEWSLDVLALRESGLRKWRRLTGPPTSFLEYALDLDAEGPFEWGSLPKSFETLRSWLKDGQSWIPRSRRYALLVQYIRRDPGSRIAKEFSRTIPAFFKNYAIEVVRDRPGESLDEFKRCYQHYSTWIDQEKLRDTCACCIEELARVYLSNKGEKTRRLNLLLFLLDSDEGISSKQRFKALVSLAADVSGDHQVEERLERVVRRLVKGDDEFLDEEFWIDQKGKSLDRIIFNVLNYRSRAGRADWQLLQSCCAYLAHRTDDIYQPRLRALTHHIEGRMHEQKNNWKEASVKFLDAVTAFRNDPLKTRSLILAFLTKAREMEENVNTQAAADYLEHYSEKVTELADDWPEVSDYWKAKLEREALIQRLSQKDWLTQNETAQELCNDLAALEARVSGHPSKMTQRWRQVITQYKKISDGDFEAAADIAEDISRVDRERGRTPHSQWILAMAVTAAGAFLAGEIEEFERSIEEARKLTGGTLSGFSPSRRIATTCHFISTSLRCLRDGEPQDEDLEHWSRQLEMTEDLSEELRRPLRHIVSAGLQGAYLSPDIRQEVHDTTVRVAEHVLTAMLQLEKMEKRRIPVADIVDNEEYLLTIPRKYTREIEEITITKETFPYIPPSAVARKCVVLDGVFGLLAPYVLGSDRTFRETLPEQLVHANRRSFGDRVEIVARWGEHINLQSRISREDLIRLVEFRNAEAHGRFVDRRETTLEELERLVDQALETFVKWTPVLAHVHDESAIGGTLIELDWSLTPHLLYLTGEDVPDPGDVLLGKESLIESLSSSTNKALQSEELDVVVEPSSDGE